MFMISAPARSKLLLQGLLVGSLMNLAVFAQSPVTKGQPASAVVPATQKATGPPTRYQPSRVSKRETAYYESVWGVDLLSVRAVESGELIRFTYQVIDPEKSKSLNDKKLEPALIFPEGHVKLIIPSLEKVGQLRQSSTPEAGKSYWMAFSNPQRTVKRGDRVDVVIGSFRAEGLIVE